MKKSYLEPEIDIVRFGEDIILTSVGEGEGEFSVEDEQGDF